MKSKIIVISICLMALYMLSACSSTDTPIEYSAIGTIESQNSIYLDEDKITVLTDNNIPAEYQAGDRVIVYFEIPVKPASGQINIQITRIQKITTSPVVTIPEADDETDTLYNAPITEIKRMWLSKDFLTVDFYYNANDTTLHQFQLAKKLSRQISADTIKLDFRHAAGDDYKIIDTENNKDSIQRGGKVRALHSFNLTSLKPINRDSIALTINTQIYRNDTTNILNSRYLYFK